MNKTLIIGGCGYIGSRLHSFLKSKGLFVDSLDLEWFGNAGIVDNYTEDYRDVSSGFYDKYENIILLAGHCNPKMCEGLPLDVFKNNVENFAYLLNEIKGQKLIYASSIGVYGKGPEGDVNEEYFGAPLNLYDFSKSTIDAYAKLSDKTYFGLRFGAVNGYSTNLRGDVIINAMTLSCMANRKLNIANAKMRRPILGISDLCNAIYRIIKFGNNQNKGIYNLASFNKTIGDIGQEVAAVLNSEVEYGKDTTGCYDCSINTSKFSDTFDFKFEDTLESIVNEISTSKLATVIPRERMIYA